VGVDSTASVACGVSESAGVGVGDGVISMGKAAGIGAVGDGKRVTVGTGVGVGDGSGVGATPVSNTELSSHPWKVRPSIVTLTKIQVSPDT